MIVREMIARLKDLPPDAEVLNNKDSYWDSVVSVDAQWWSDDENGIVDDPSEVEGEVYQVVAIW